MSSRCLDSDQELPGEPRRCAFRKATHAGGTGWQWKSMQLPARGLARPQRPRQEEPAGGEADKPRSEFTP